MGIADVLSWTVVGVVAGGLAGMLVPGRTPGGLIGVIVIGLLGALVGGWGAALLFDSGPSSFLGSVIVGVCAASALLYVLYRTDNGHYRP